MSAGMLSIQQYSSIESIKLRALFQVVCESKGQSKYCNWGWQTISSSQRKSFRAGLVSRSNAFFKILESLISRRCAPSPLSLISSSSVGNNKRRASERLSLLIKKANCLNRLINVVRSGARRSSSWIIFLSSSINSGNNLCSSGEDL
ncbi:hypothetical protein ES708_12583 [subsurface metagenome]